jgi:thiamine-phosphate pyrophosphorylase
LILYYITDRSVFSGDESEKRRRLLSKIAEAASAGVDYIQLREKNLVIRELEELATQAQRAVAGSRSRLLINSRLDVACAVGAAGVHLRSDDMAASEARSIFSFCGRDAMPIAPVIAVSCHTDDEVALAESHGADFAVFGPVFEKNGRSARTGVDLLRKACRRPAAAASMIPVLALGGVTLANAAKCIAAGAAGIAGIRLFQENDVASVVQQLRDLLPSAGSKLRSHQRHPYQPR